MLKYQTLAVTSFAQNCSLIWCSHTNKAALIDPGGEADKLISIIKQLDLQIEKILLTHGHIDHVGASKALADTLQIPIHGPQKDDLFWLQHMHQQAEMFGFTPSDPFEPDHWLEENDEITLGEIKMIVKHCPGHTPGHIIFYNSESNTAFVGDVLFKGSIGRTDFPQGNHATLINSIKEKLLPLGDEVTFVPGHGPNSTFGHERIHNPFLNDNF